MDDVIGLLIWVVFVVIGMIATAVQGGKKKQEEEQGEAPRRRVEAAGRPGMRLPDGTVILPGGQVLLPGEAESWGAPAAPGARFPARVPAPPPAGHEASSSEEEPGDRGTLEEIPEFEAYTLEPPDLPDWDRGAQPRPEPVRAVLETTDVDWTAEHERFHKKYVDQVDAPRPATHGALDILRGRKALRQAVLAAEVLGPPRALRDF